MKDQLKGYRSIYPRVDRRDRFAALREVKLLLGSKNIDLTSMFTVLFQVNNGELEVNVGDLSIQFARGFRVWSDNKDVIQLSIELRKEDFGEIVTYQYRLDELFNLDLDNRSLH